jgi:SAM-dependent methyltransferase
LALSEAIHPARLAYDSLAADYDDFTATLDYEPWLAAALPRLERWGLAGTRVLDVGCGTGKSLVPMLERGWQCSGCDISPAMVGVAQEKIGTQARLIVADMRDLPRIGSFDLVWSLNDSVNYLLDRRQLELALRSMRKNMAEAGLLVFDLNTILTYRTYFAERRVVACNGRRVVWDGRAAGDQAPGSIATAHVEAEGETESAHLHRQRHFPEGEVLDALERADLECAEVLGQGEDGTLHRPLRELSHVKALYIARRRDRQHRA